MVSVSSIPRLKSFDEIEKEKRIELIQNDINKINDSILNDDKEKLLLLHKMIDGKYGAYIPNWDNGTYCYIPGTGFHYDILDNDSLKHNLTMFSAKLEGYLIDFPIKTSSNLPQNNVNVTVENKINISITFEQAKQQIEDMPGLTDKETEEIIERINELENISKESISKKKKWEKVKPILTFALDKSVDVAIAIMSLILQMKLGM